MYIQLFLFTHIYVYMFSIERRTKTIRLASAMRIDRIGCSCQARSASDGLPYVSLLGSVNILVQTDCSTNYPLVSVSYVCPGAIVGKNGEVLFLCNGRRSRLGVVVKLLVALRLQRRRFVYLH